MKIKNPTSYKAIALILPPYHSICRSETSSSISLFKNRRREEDRDK